MTITSIHLSAFGSFAGTTLDTAARRILIAGVNGSGKTTLREAIKWALTGRCRVLNGKGQGVADLIPVGSRGPVSVQVTLDGLGPVTRTWTSPASTQLEVEGFEGNPTDVQAAIYESLRTTPEFLTACLDSEMFLHLHHAEAKAFVLGLLHVSVTVNDRTYTLPQLDAAYEQAYKDRTAAKTLLKSAFVPAKPEGDAKPVAAVQQRLAELRATLAEQQRAIGAMTATKAGLMSEAQRVSGTVSVETDQSRDQVVAAIESLEERLAIMEAEVAAPVPDPAVRPDGEVNVPVLRSRAEALTQFQPKHGCVLDGEIPCPVHKLKFANRGKDLLEQIAKIPTPSAPTIPPPNPMTAVRADLERWTRLLASIEAAETENARRAAERTRIAQALAAVPDTTAQDAALAEVTSRIRTGETILAEAQRYAAACTAFTQAVAHRQTLQADVDRLEALVDALGPNGARVAALTEAIGKFNAAVTASTLPFGWTVEVSAEPWGVRVNGRPLETYSKSERHRIGVAIQMAVAQLSGLSIAIVDELDMLTADNRALMSAIVWNAPLAQVFILSSREPSDPLPTHTPKPGFIGYRLAVVRERSGIQESTDLVPA